MKGPIILHWIKLQAQYILLADEMTTWHKPAAPGSCTEVQSLQQGLLGCAKRFKSYCPVCWLLLQY